MILGTVTTILEDTQNLPSVRFEAPLIIFMGGFEIQIQWLNTYHDAKIRTMSQANRDKPSFPVRKSSFYEFERYKALYS